jgi:hypothetical protein
MYFYIKKEDDLCFTMNWNETARHNKVEWKFITWKTFADEISKGETFTLATMAFWFCHDQLNHPFFLIQGDFTFFSQSTNGGWVTWWNI